MRFPKGIDPDRAIPAYVAACQGYSIQVVADTIRKFLRGGFEDVDKRFCPTPPELGDMMRQTQPEKRKPVSNVWPEDVDPVTAAFKAYRAPTPEAKARVDEMIRKYRAGIPVNDAVARHWAKMVPLWASGNPAYAGLTAGTPPPPPRSEAERMADLEAHANDPIGATPALLKKLGFQEGRNPT